MKVLNDQISMKTHVELFFGCDYCVIEEITKNI